MNNEWVHRFYRPHTKIMKTEGNVQEIILCVCVFFFVKQLRMK